MRLLLRHVLSRNHSAVHPSSHPPPPSCWPFASLPLPSALAELPDGSLVLHYSSEGAAARRKEGRLVSFLTKPVPGQRRREVPKDVLQQILGGAPRDSGTTSNGASASTHNQ